MLRSNLEKEQSLHGNIIYRIMLGSNNNGESIRVNKLIFYNKICMFNNQSFIWISYIVLWCFKWLFFQYLLYIFLLSILYRPIIFKLNSILVSWIFIMHVLIIVIKCYLSLYSFGWFICHFNWWIFSISCVLSLELFNLVHLSITSMWVYLNQTRLAFIYEFIFIE